MVEIDRSKTFRANGALRFFLAALRKKGYSILDFAAENANLLQALSSLWLASPRGEALLSRMLLNVRGNPSAVRSRSGKNG